MKITFIGTSHGVPSAQRYCTCILVETGDSFFFIDAGAPIADVIQRRGLDMNKFKGIFTTHAHGDHTAGVFQITDLMNWYFKSTSADFVLADPEQIEALKSLINISCNKSGIDGSRIRFGLAQEGVVYDDGKIRVEYILNQHMTTSPSYSILVSVGEKKVLFSGDFSNGLKACDLPVKVLNDRVDAFVCELAHFSLENLMPYIEDADLGKLFITHVYPDSKYADVESIKGKCSFEVITPNDGDVYEI